MRGEAGVNQRCGGRRERGEEREESWRGREKRAKSDIEADRDSV